MPTTIFHSLQEELKAVKFDLDVDHKAHDHIPVINIPGLGSG